jgi:undecaprenyl-diphosphatase
MENIKFLILGIVQGITELLPISSSGHLLLFSDIMNFELDLNSLLLSVLHIGTTLAIIVFSRKILFKNLFSKEKLLFYVKIVVASIPAGIVGIFLGDFIENQLRATWIIAVSLIVWGIVMIIAEQTRKDVKKADTNIENISWKQSIAMGFGQTLALIPGTSRSGITTLTGMLTGLDKYTAFEYSFILGIPVLLGASLIEIFKAYLEMETVDLNTIFASTLRMTPVILISFTVGYLALITVKRYQKKNWLTVFGIYRIILGIIILLI